LPQSLPLIYSGEEANNKKRLQFFEKDLITWGDTSLYGWYRKMNALKHNQPALANGKYGAPTKFINLNNSEDLSNYVTCHALILTSELCIKKFVYSRVFIFTLQKHLHGGANMI
jgi:hypothetical protein